MINNLHTLSGVLFLVSFGIKIPLHAYLDFKNGKKNSVQSIVFFPLTYLGRHRDNVDAEYKWIKNGCNILYYSAILFFVLNLTLGIIEI